MSGRGFLTCRFSRPSFFLTESAPSGYVSVLEMVFSLSLYRLTALSLPFPASSCSPSCPPFCLSSWWVAIISGRDGAPTTLVPLPASPLFWYALPFFTFDESTSERYSSELFLCLVDPGSGPPAWNFFLIRTDSSSRTRGVIPVSPPLLNPIVFSFFPQRTGRGLLDYICLLFLLFFFLRPRWNDYLVEIVEDSSLLSLAFFCIFFPEHRSRWRSLCLFSLIHCRE